ncbi:5' nucleotidase, NT5C type [Macrococcus carouselicus]|uniref:Nucleotidase n=1 Tax=Macrococcus carouselicus TaxID=69969 RepID=A0A9Q8CP88_9STAP|nr:hypothetical protein [Macrococcus carouselicus]TDM04359.1 hypothetical protein ERX40_04100 [Macrococcus carouselicus]
MQQIKRLGIDIDGTVTCPTSLVPYLQKSFDAHLRYEDITAYDLGVVLGKSDAEMYDWFMANQEEIYTHSPIAEGALPVLKEWSAQYELVYISARYDYLDQVTADWFAKYDVPFHHIELTGSHDKIETARNLEVDVFFEDKLDNAIAIHEELDIPVVLFDTPYNQAALPENIHRVFTWDEAKKVLSTL